MIAYTAEGIVEIEALGDSVVMDTSVEYDDPDLLVGAPASAFGLKYPAVEGGEPGCLSPVDSPSPAASSLVNPVPSPSCR